MVKSRIHILQETLKWINHSNINIGMRILRVITVYLWPTSISMIANLRGGVKPTRTSCSFPELPRSCGCNWCVSVDRFHHNCAVGDELFYNFIWSRPFHVVDFRGMLINSLIRSAETFVCRLLHSCWKCLNLRIKLFATLTGCDK